jgi:hypothetical protein
MILLPLEEAGFFGSAPLARERFRAVHFVEVGFVDC